MSPLHPQERCPRFRGEGDASSVPSPERRRRLKVTNTIAREEMLWRNVSLRKSLFGTLTCLMKVIGLLPIACASPMLALITDENGFSTPWWWDSNDTLCYNWMDGQIWWPLQMEGSSMPSIRLEKSGTFRSVKYWLEAIGWRRGTISFGWRGAISFGWRIGAIGLRLYWMNKRCSICNWPL